MYQIQQDEGRESYGCVVSILLHLKKSPNFLHIKIVAIVTYCYSLLCLLEKALSIAPPSHMPGTFVKNLIDLYNNSKV